MHILINFFNQPFPEDQTMSRRLLSNVLIAIFISTFLYVFEPFGLDEAPGSLLRHALIYGAITLTVCLLFDLAYRLLGVETDVPTWTLGKWALGLLGLVLTIGTCNFIYTIQMGGGDFNLTFLIGMVGRTALVAFFPILLTGMLKIRSRSAYYSGVSTELHPVQSTGSRPLDVYLVDDKGVEIYRIDKRDLLYIESQKNYVLLHLRSVATPERLRITLSDAAGQLDAHGILRCHRSFAINLSTVGEVTGNAQGLQLHITDTDQIVPVSRSYVNVVRAVFQ